MRNERTLQRARLSAMGFKTYDAYLRSRRWTRRRAEYRETHDPICCVCSATRKLQLHHTTYVRLGWEIDQDLCWLCDLCHSTVHEMDDVSLDPQVLFSAERQAAYRAKVAAREPYGSLRPQAGALPRREKS
jgi:hypothetical protein